MPRTPAEQAEWEQQCYGCSEADHRAGIDGLVEQYFGNANMSLGSILSDAQALMEVVEANLDPTEPPQNSWTRLGNT